MKTIKKCNCFIFAFRLWMRNPFKRSLHMRRYKGALLPHFWVKDEYGKVNRYYAKTLPISFWRSFWYEGRVRRHRRR